MNCHKKYMSYNLSILYIILALFLCMDIIDIENPFPMI